MKPRKTLLRDLQVLTGYAHPIFLLLEPELVLPSILSVSASSSGVVASNTVLSCVSLAQSPSRNTNCSDPGVRDGVQKDKEKDKARCCVAFCDCLKEQSLWTKIGKQLTLVKKGSLCLGESTCAYIRLQCRTETSSMYFSPPNTTL